MSEDYPIKEDITQAVVAALELITPANGYVTDGVEVVRPRRTGENYTPAANGIAVLQSSEDAAEQWNLAGNPPAIGWRLGITCDLVARLSEKDARPMDQVLNLFEADVRKALMADVTFGGVALDAELGGTEYPAAVGGFEGLTQWIYVFYRVAENDPYTNMV